MIAHRAVALTRAARLREITLSAFAKFQVSGLFVQVRQVPVTSPHAKRSTLLAFFTKGKAAYLASPPITSRHSPQNAPKPSQRQAAAMSPGPTSGERLSGGGSRGGGGGGDGGGGSSGVAGGSKSGGRRRRNKHRGRQDSWAQATSGWEGSGDPSSPTHASNEDELRAVLHLPQPDTVE